MESGQSVGMWRTGVKVMGNGDIYRKKNQKKKKVRGPTGGPSSTMEGRSVSPPQRLGPIHRPYGREREGALGGPFSTMGGRWRPMGKALPSALHC